MQVGAIIANVSTRPELSLVEPERHRWSGKEQLSEMINFSQRSHWERLCRKLVVVSKARPRGGRRRIEVGRVWVVGRKEVGFEMGSRKRQFG